MEDFLQASAAAGAYTHSPWDKGKLVGANPPLRPSHVWSIRKSWRSRSARGILHRATPIGGGDRRPGFRRRLRSGKGPFLYCWIGLNLTPW